MTACPQCQTPVITARFRDARGFRVVAIERCAAGHGDLAIFPVLFDDGRPPVVELVSNGTTYRMHPPHTSVLSFTGQGRDRKRAP
jgi:hypothetical protein